jgi:hypothetical protein
MLLADQHELYGVTVVLYIAKGQSCSPTDVHLAQQMMGCYELTDHGEKVTNLKLLHVVVVSIFGAVTPMKGLKCFIICKSNNTKLHIRISRCVRRAS